MPLSPHSDSVYITNTRVWGWASVKGLVLKVIDCGLQFCIFSIISEQRCLRERSEFGWQLESRTDYWSQRFDEPVGFLGFIQNSEVEGGKLEGLQMILWRSGSRTCHVDPISMHSFVTHRFNYYTKIQKKKCWQSLLRFDYDARAVCVAGRRDWPCWSRGLSPWILQALSASSILTRSKKLSCCVSTNTACVHKSFIFLQWWW